MFYCDKTATELVVPTKKAYELFKEKYKVDRNVYIVPTGIEVEKFYLENNKDEWDKYMPLLLDILNKIEEIIFKHSNMTNDEILNGFIV